ncbi:MAG TPA: hypothetical protein VMC42_08785 [Methanoregulaceae archaeon]|nr:hypothetical protein [Methanoregulaceae archaeon]
MNAMKTSLVVLILLCLAVPLASASISVVNMAVSPSGDLVSGQTPPTAVTATFRIEFDPEGGETFSAGDTLLMATDLDNAKWTYTVALDGNPNPGISEIGKNVNINGWILNYPSKRDLAMSVTLNGDVPSVNTSGNITIVRVADIGSKGTPVKGSEDITTRNVINPADKTKAVTDEKTQLTQFRSAIDAKSAEGIDTSAAAQKYSEASTAIQNADKATSSAVSQSYLNQATTAIKDGQTALAKAETQKVIIDAQKPIDQTDDLITYFKVNRSMGKDPRLTPIIDARDRAADLISEANDLLSRAQTTDDFSNVRDKALQASDKGQEAYNDALALKKDVGDSNPMDSVTKIFGGIGSGIAGVLIYIVIIVVIGVLVVVGIILIRRHKDWDELA